MTPKEKIIKQLEETRHLIPINSDKPDHYARAIRAIQSIDNVIAEIKKL